MCFALLGAGPAFAHGDIQRIRPEPESVLGKAPDHIRITYTEAPTENNRISVTDGCGTDVLAEKYVQGRTLHVFLREGEPGNFDVSYAVISAVDGHKTNGDFSFTVRGEADCSEPSAEPEPPEDDADNEGGEDEDSAAQPGTSPTSGEGSSGIPVAVVAVGVLALIGIAFLVRMGAARG